MVAMYLPTSDYSRAVPKQDEMQPSKTTTPTTPFANTTTSTTTNDTANAKELMSKEGAAVKAKKELSGKKKKTSVYRRRLRRRGQREEPTLTRLAAVLGQIKEACMEEEVGTKIAPLIESATRMIEALSENQKQQTLGQSGVGVANRNKGTDGSRPSEATDVTEPTTAASPMKTTPDRGKVVPGSKIPPYIYRPRNHPGTGPMQQDKPNHYMTGSRLAIPVHYPPVMTTASKEAAQMDQMKLQMRSRLRAATTIEDFHAIALEAERLGMTHETTAAWNHIGKLKAQAEASKGYDVRKYGL